jgi:hypothetical protein
MYKDTLPFVIVICLSSYEVEGFLFGYVEILENFNFLVINLGFFKTKIV